MYKAGKTWCFAAIMATTFLYSFNSPVRKLLTRLLPAKGRLKR
nr:KxYKxGKxW signal peptide domain-containing protein [Oenococcus oeni]